MAILSTYYIGLNNKDTHRQELKTSQAIEVLVKTLKERKVESYSYSFITGVYKGEVENTIKLELVDCGLCNQTIQELKRAFNQECILETVTILAQSIYH